MMCAASDFMPASELPASPSREEQLEAIIRTQAAALERYEAMLDGQPQQQAGGSMSGQEKAAIIAALSKLDDRLKDLELSVKPIVDKNDANDSISYNLEEVKGLLKEHNVELTDIRDARRFDKNRLEDLSAWLEDLQAAVDKLAKRPTAGKKSQARIAKLKEILKAGPKSYGELERLLEISPKEMNRLVSMLDSRSYEIFFRAGDGRQKVLRLRNWGRSLTSNVKYSAEGPSKDS